MISYEYYIEVLSLDQDPLSPYCTHGTRGMDGEGSYHQSIWPNKQERLDFPVNDYMEGHGSGYEGMLEGNGQGSR